MDVMLALISMWLVGALLIEISAHYRMCSAMDRRVAALNIPNNPESAERNAEQPKPDNREQNNVHRFISFERVGRA